MSPIPPTDALQSGGERVATEASSGRYRVLAPLAEGGMGTVQRALDGSSGRALAIKRVKSAEPNSAQLRAALEREYRVLSSLKHPRIIEVYDYGVDQDGPYYTMELLSGEDLRAAAPLPWRRACGVVRDVATSLALLHARRLVYRDLNPSNVRLTDDGRAKLLDFGALTGFGYCDNIIGAAPVIAPEALRGGMLDARTDLYALGALLYYCLTGQHAYAAKRVDELPRAWATPPVAPSRLMEDVPRELDALVAELLNDNPQARPSSAAEVYARLTALATLPHEHGDETVSLAQSFLTNPRFVGREQLLGAIDVCLAELASGRGAALHVESAAGCGRTRVLEEAGVRAQLGGACVLRVDAGADGSLRGLARSLATCLLTALPVLARSHARSLWQGLEPLGADISSKLREEALPAPEAERLEVSSAMRRWLLSLSAERPLLLAVDNIEHADDASLGLLAELAREAPRHPLVLMVTERATPDAERRAGHVALDAYAAQHVLHNLIELEVRDLARSLFGEAPNLARFSEWLYAATAGNPLHCLEMVKQLLAQGSIRFANGAFTLPDHRPDVRAAGALQDALLSRMEGLDSDAISLAECLALQRAVASHALCAALFGDAPEETRVRGLLDQLVHREVLVQEAHEFRFSATALREALLAKMDSHRRRINHRRLGAALLRLAAPDDHVLRVQAGHHLIQGGEEARGADMLARIMANSAVMRTLAANLHQMAGIAEEALLVYERDRRSVYERIPFLSVLLTSGYYEDYRWAVRYGDRALDALEYASGLGLARRLAPLLGKKLAVILGVLLAALRFRLVPRRERVYDFREVLVQLFAAASNAMALAVLSLDGGRADRIAELLEPFSALPQRLTPAGIHQFVHALRFITREEQAKAQAAYRELIRRFSDPRYYPTLPRDARPLYVNGCRFASASFAVFRNDGREALEHARELDAADLRMYRMIASQMRYLYHAYRGELGEAARHRDQVEIHAAHVGSAAQVEIWEPAALLPLYIMLEDGVGLTRSLHRLESLRASLPSLGAYADLAAAALALVRDKNPRDALARYGAALENRPPRSMIGWAVGKAMMARAHNAMGEYASAAQLCEQVLAHMMPIDVDYVTIFLYAELQLAEAELGLGRVDSALGRLDRLRAQHGPSQHPLALGLIAGVRAKVALCSGQTELFEASMAEMEGWFVPTGTPPLIAQCERLRALAAPRRAQALPSAGLRTEPENENSQAETLMLGRSPRTETLAVTASRQRAKP